MPRLVGRLEHVLELAKALAVSPSASAALSRARTLFERDDAVLDDLGEDLLVVDFELTEPEVASDLPLSNVLRARTRTPLSSGAPSPPG
jgi:hypothetical protein